MPHNFFTKSISKKSGNWATKTLEQVRKTWDVRRNALEVVERLKLGKDSVNAILALSWRLKGQIMRFLGTATEQGVGIKNPVGLFFALTKKPKPSTT